LIPAIVTLFEITAVFKATHCIGVKLNVSGIESDPFQIVNDPVKSVPLLPHHSLGSNKDVNIAQGIAE
jgi:hypothetical protein